MVIFILLVRFISWIVNKFHSNNEYIAKKKNQLIGIERELKKETNFYYSTRVKL